MSPDFRVSDFLSYSYAEAFSHIDFLSYSHVQKNTESLRMLSQTQWSHLKRQFYSFFYTCFVKVKLHLDPWLNAKGVENFLSHF